MRSGRARLLQAVAFAVASLMPVVASAQAVAPADAKPFLGGWTLGMESPQGAVTFDLTIKDQGGKVAGREVMTIVPQADVPKIQKDTPPRPGTATVQALKGGDYIRVWINRGGNYYLVYFAV